MNENLDLTKILKDVPSGTKLYSPICGECELKEIDGENTYPIICKTKSDSGNIVYEAFSAEGKLYCDYKNGECVLFPSKENRDWSTFKAPNTHKHFEPGQKVLVPYNNGTTCKLRLTFYSHYDESPKQHFTTDAMCFSDKEVIAYKGNEDKLGKRVE